MTGTPRHGTLTSYVRDKCRCDECARHHYRHQKRYRLRRERGEQFLVDAGPARAHVAALRDAGMSMWAITLAAGWRSRNALYTMLTHPRITARTEARILAVRPDMERRDDAYVSAGPTAERLRDLALLGWTLRGLSAELGMDTDTCRRIVSGKRLKVRRRTALAVLRMWAERGGTPGPSERTRTWAARQPWAPGGEYDGCGRCEDVQWLREQGEGRSGICERLGVSWPSLERHLYRHQRADLVREPA